MLVRMYRISSVRSRKTSKFPKSAKNCRDEFKLVLPRLLDFERLCDTGEAAGFFVAAISGPSKFAPLTGVPRSAFRRRVVYDDGGVVPEGMRFRVGLGSIMLVRFRKNCMVRFVKSSWAG